MKKLIVILCVFAFIGGVFLMFFSKLLSKGILEGVNEYAPKITQTSVVLDDAELSAFSGSGKLTGLTVGNPEGFKTDHAMKLGMVSVSMEPMSVMSDKIVVKEVIIDGPEIIYETNRGLKTNIGEILKNVEAFTGVEEEEEIDEESMRIELGLFRLTQGKVTISNDLLQGKGLEVELPPIEITDIGTGPEGATLSDVLKRVIASINSETIAAVGKSGSDIGKQVEDIGKDAKKNVSDLLKGFKDSVKTE